MKRYTFGTALSVTTVALIGCANPVIVTKPPATEQAAAVAAETPPLVGTTFVDENGDYYIEFPLPESSGGKASLASSADGRSLVNYENTTDLQNAVNYYQLVLVDDDESDKIWASTSATPTSAPDGVLSVLVKPGHTYHLLLLHGRKDGANDPTLLASGYLKYLIQATNTVIIRMVPVLIDATITKADTPTAPWVSTDNIAWVKDEPFDVTLKLYSRFGTQESTANNAKPHGNALWPLILAQERGTPAVWAA